MLWSRSASFDQQDADVGRHRQQKTTEVLRLLAFLETKSSFQLAEIDDSAGIRPNMREISSWSRRCPRDVLGAPPRWWRRPCASPSGSPRPRGDGRSQDRLRSPSGRVSSSVDIGPVGRPAATGLQRFTSVIDELRTDASWRGWAPRIEPDGQVRNLSEADCSSPAARRAMVVLAGRGRRNRARGC